MLQCGDTADADLLVRTGSSEVHLKSRSANSQFYLVQLVYSSHEELIESQMRYAALDRQIRRSLRGMRSTRQLATDWQRFAVEQTKIRKIR